MSKHNYDIFISYRKRCSGDKPEMLQLMLEESGFRKRVSFDKDNLNGRFDVELIRRIDECKDFIMFMVPETFTTIRPLNEEAVETGEKATWDMEEVAFYERMASLTYEEFETEIKQISHTGEIDFVRIELDRALHRRSRNPKQINIIPIAPQESESYDFATLQLPPDISGLKDFQAVFYSNSRVARFKDIKGDLLKQMLSKPSYVSAKWLVMTFIALSLIVAGNKTYTSIQRTAEQKLEFKDCRTYDDYSSFIKKHPDSSLKSTCDSILHEFNVLRNDGRASVNNTGNRDIKDREKEWVDVKWNPIITLPQLRSLVEMMNNMLLIPAKNKVMNDSIVTEEGTLPMTHITWNDAEAFTKKLNKLTGLPFSLPTEAQWEYAAVGGESYPYAGSDNIRDVAYYASNANERLHPVGEKRENGFDLYDMSGNAAEWCTDWMSRYENTRVTDPQGPAENPGHHKKIVRGGSYLANERDMDIRHRSVQTYDTSEPHIGFRVVLNPIQ